MSDIIQTTKTLFMVTGTIMVLLGLTAIALPLAASMAIEIIFGWIFILGGIATAVHSLRAQKCGKCFLRLIGGILYFMVGLMFLKYPNSGIFTLGLLLAFVFMTEGMIKLVIAAKLGPQPKRGWLLISGLAGIAVALIIFLGFPGETAWVLGVLVGVNLLLSGLTMLMVPAIID